MKKHNRRARLSKKQPKKASKVRSTRKPKSKSRPRPTPPKKRKSAVKESSEFDFKGYALDTPVKSASKESLPRSQPSVKMNRLGDLFSKGLLVEYDFTTPLVTLANNQDIDAFIFESHHGFVPLDDGEVVPFLAKDLGIPVERIHHHADWNRFENKGVTLIALRPCRDGGLLRGVILAPGETCKCYERFARLPHPAFYYNVSYQSIAHLCELKARKIGMTHLSASGSFNREIATCNLEALAHFLDEENALSLDRFAFVGCCIKLAHLQGIPEQLNNRARARQHPPITVRVEEIEAGITYIHLRWNSLDDNQDALKSSTGN